MTTDQFDNFQLDPSAIGSDWTFTGQQATINRGPMGSISNPQYKFVEPRYTYDRTRVTFDFSHEENPERTIGAGFAGWGVDWSLFNYNPFGGRGDGKNVNFRVNNDWLQITGLGGISVETKDVSDSKGTDPSGMVAYRNYPREGFSSFGKTTGGASPDKRWAWKGNTWVPAA
jgi:hypothetical protein